MKFFGPEHSRKRSVTYLWENEMTRFPVLAASALLLAVGYCVGTCPAEARITQQVSGQKKATAQAKNRKVRIALVGILRFESTIARNLKVGLNIQLTQRFLSGCLYAMFRLEPPYF